MAQRAVVVSDFHSAAQPCTCGGKLRLQPSLDLIMITPIADTGRRLPRHDALSIWHDCDASAFEVIARPQLTLMPLADAVRYAGAVTLLCVKAGSLASSL